MSRALKRPDGMLFEEYVVSGVHFVEGGAITCHNHDITDGEYTGRFGFKFKGTGKITPWYTRKTAPMWLLQLYNEATTTTLDKESK